MNQIKSIQSLSQLSNVHNIELKFPNFKKHLERLALFETIFDSRNVASYKKLFIATIAENVKQNGRTLQACCKLRDLHLDFPQFFLSHMEAKAEQYLLNNPADKEFKENWQSFRVTAARSLYRIDKNIINQARKHLEQVQAKLKSIDQNLPKKRQEHEILLQKTFLEIAAKDLRLIEVPVALLTGISSCDSDGNYSIKTTSKALLETNNFLIKNLQQNLPWLLKCCENRLKQFSNSTNKELTNFINLLLEKINFCRSSVLPKLPKLILTENDYNINTNKYVEILNELNDAIAKNLFNLDQWNSIEVEEEETDLQLPPSEILKKSWKNCKFMNSFNVMSLSYDPLRDSLELLQKKKEQPVNKEMASTKEIEEAMQSIEELIRFREAFQECTEIMSIYYKYPFAKLFAVNSAYVSWLSSDKIRKELTLNVDDIASSIEDKKPKKRTKRTPKKGKQAHRKEVQAVPAVEKPEIETRTKPASNSIVVPSLSDPEQISLALAHIVRQSDFERLSTERHAYRQAHMYLEDLIVATDEIQRNPIESVKLFYSNTIVQSAYLFLEQLLQCQFLHSQQGLHSKDDNKPGHNLITLLKKLTHAPLSSSAIELAKELSVAYLWTRCTYEQDQRRNEIGAEIPLCLRTIQQIYDAEVFSNKKIGQQVNRILTYCKRVSAFVQELPMASEWKNPRVRSKNEIKDFSHRTRIDPRKYDDLIVSCKALLRQMPLYLQPVFKQAICHLELLKGCLHELSKESISSVTFSFLVRSLLFWENTVLEEFLRTLYGLNNGVNSISHKVNKLYELSVSNYDEKKEDIEFLSASLSNVHNISRYPFSIAKGSLLARHLILNAEMLRECSELGSEEEPFKLEGNKTALNYIPIREQLNPEEIMKRLTSLSNRMSTLIQKRIVPEIRQHFQ